MYFQNQWQLSFGLCIIVVTSRKEPAPVALVYTPIAEALSTSSTRVITYTVEYSPAFLGVVSQEPLV